MPSSHLLRSHVFALLTAMSVCAIGQSPSSSSPPPAEWDIRFVVLHTPGPAWQPGKSLFEQQGVREHVEHYRKFLTQGKLVIGGPHLDAKGGGMMIPARGVSEQEIRAYAAEDPAVKSGVLLAEVRPWLIGMAK